MLANLVAQTFWFSLILFQPNTYMLKLFILIMDKYHAQYKYTLYL